jgi:hypothetical protein
MRATAFQGNALEQGSTSTSPVKGATDERRISRGVHKRRQREITLALSSRHSLA